MTVMAEAHLKSVTGLGDPVLDIVARVPHQLLEDLHAAPGGCIRVEQEEMQQLLSLPEVQEQALRVPGGSAANVMKGLAGLTAGARPVTFVGMVGLDAAGQEYRQKLQSWGVGTRFLLESSSGAPTATCLCLVTPDGQRTMRTCLCAAMELATPSLLPPGLVPPSGMLHCEGYCLYRPAVAEAAMRAAHAVGGSVSLDLASFEVVRGCFGALLGLLGGDLVDLVFCNEQEAQALCQAAALDPGPDPDSAVEMALGFLLQHCSVAVCSRGPKGCVARSRVGDVACAPASSVQVVDTVGAGDHFTAGFLEAWLQGGSLQACAACACAAGTAAVQVAGAALGGEALQHLRARVAEILRGQGAGSGS